MSEHTGKYDQKLLEEVRKIRKQLAEVHKLLDDLGPDNTPDRYAKLVIWCKNYDEG